MIVFCKQKFSLFKLILLKNNVFCFLFFSTLVIGQTPSPGPMKALDLSFEYPVSYVSVDKEHCVTFYQEVYSDYRIENEVDLYLESLSNILPDLSYTTHKKYTYYKKWHVDPKGKRDAYSLIPKDFIKGENVLFTSKTLSEASFCNMGNYMQTLNKNYTLVHVNDKVLVMDTFCNIIYSFSFKIASHFELYESKNGVVFIVKKDTNYLLFWNL